MPKRCRFHPREHSQASKPGPALAASRTMMGFHSRQAYFVQSASKSSDFKYSLPYHRKVFEAIRRRQPEVARRAMQQMILDSRANMTGKRHARTAP